MDEAVVVAALTDRERRRSVDQALANARIEGHVPSAAFLADCEQFVQGRLSTQELRAASLARAIAAERAAAAPARVQDAA